MSTATEQRLRSIVARKLDVAPDQVPLDEPIMDGLGLDSLDAMAVVLEIEEAYEHVTLTEGDVGDLVTLRDVAAHIDRAAPG